MQNMFGVRDVRQGNLISDVNDYEKSMNDEFQNQNQQDALSSSSWIPSLFNQLELDRTLGFSLRLLFRNKFCIPSDPYKTILHVLRGREYIRNFPHNMQYSDIEIDVIMPRSSDDIPLTQIALIDENNSNIVTTVDVRRGGKVAFADSYPWGKAALSLRHLVKLAGPDPVKNQTNINRNNTYNGGSIGDTLNRNGAPVDSSDNNSNSGSSSYRHDQWMSSFETAGKRCFYVLSLIRNSLRNPVMEVTHKNGVNASFIESVSIDHFIGNNIAISTMDYFDMTVEIIIEGASLDDALLLLVKRIAEEGYQAENSVVIGAVLLKVETEIAGKKKTGDASANMRTVSITMDDMKTKRSEIIGVIKAAIIDGGTVSLNFHMIMERILPASLVGKVAVGSMQRDPYLGNMKKKTNDNSDNNNNDGEEETVDYEEKPESNNQKDEAKNNVNDDSKDNDEDDQNKLPVSRMSRGFISVKRRYKFTYVESKTSSRSSNKSSSSAKQQQQATTCFHKLPFESLGSGVFFQASDAARYRKVYHDHVKTSQAALKRGRSAGHSTSGRDTMIDDVIKEISSNCVALFDNGDPAHACRQLLKVLAIETTMRTSITYVIKQCSTLLTGICGLVGCVMNAGIKLKAVLLYIRNHLGRHSDMNTLEYALNVVHKHLHIDEAAISDLDSNVNNNNIQPPTMQLAIFVYSVYDSLMEYRSMVLHLISQGPDNSTLHALQTSISVAISSLFSAESIINPRKWLHASFVADKRNTKMPVSARDAEMRNKIEVIKFTSSISATLRRELSEIYQTISHLEGCLRMLHTSISCDVMMQLMRDDADGWDRVRVHPKTNTSVLNSLFKSKPKQHPWHGLDFEQKATLATEELVVEQMYLDNNLPLGDPVVNVATKSKNYPTSSNNNNAKTSKGKSIGIDPDEEDQYVGLFDTGYPFKSIYEPPLTFSDMLASTVAWDRGLQHWSKLSIDLNTRFFLERSLTISKDDLDPQLGDRSKHLQKDTDGMSGLGDSHLWADVGIVSEEAALRGLNDQHYQADSMKLLSYHGNEAHMSNNVPLPNRKTASKRSDNGDKGRYNTLIDRISIEPRSSSIITNAADAGRDNKKNKSNESMIALSQLEAQLQLRARWTSCWSLFSTLGLHWNGRQRCVSVFPAYKEEKSRGETSNASAFDMVKIRYLHETRLTSALQEAYFLICTMPHQRNRYSAMTQCLQKYSSFIHLWRYKDHSLRQRICGNWQGLLRHQGCPSTPLIEKDVPIKGCAWLKFASDNNSVSSLIDYKDIKSNMTSRNIGNLAIERDGESLNGGIFGPEGIIRSLCDWSELLRRTWSLPAIFSNNPIPSLSALRELIKSPKYLSKADNLNTNALSLVRTSVFMGMNFESARRLSRVNLPRDLHNGERDDGTGGVFTPLTNKDYYAKLNDKPNQNNRGNNKKSGYSTSSTSSSDPLLRQQVYPLAMQDPENGCMKGPNGKLQLEVVIHVTCPTNSSLKSSENSLMALSRSIYAQSIVNCLVGLSTNSRYILHRLSPYGQPRKVVPKNLEDLSKNISLQNSIYDALYESSECVLDCLCALPEEAVSINDGTAGCEATGFEDIRKYLVQRSRIGYTNSQNNPYNQQETFNDPTSDDIARIVATSDESIQLNEMSKKRISTSATSNTGHSRNKVPLTYQVCQITFTLLTVQEAMDMRGKLIEAHDPDAVNADNFIEADSINNIRNVPVGKDYNTFTSKRSNLNLMDRFNGIKESGIYNLAIGRDESIARLIANTIWYSPLAIKCVWSCAGSTSAIEKCCHYLAKKSHRMYCNYIKPTNNQVPNYIEAYNKAWTVLALTSPTGAIDNNSPMSRYGPMLCRMDSSLANKLHLSIQALDNLKDLLTRVAAGGSEMSSYSPYVLGHTVSRHVCLTIRLCVQSPSSLHLRGGCIQLLRRVEQLEMLLRLGRIPLIATHFPPSTNLCDPRTASMGNNNFIEGLSTIAGFAADNSADYEINEDMPIYQERLHGSNTENLNYNNPNSRSTGGPSARNRNKGGREGGTESNTGAAGKHKNKNRNNKVDNKNGNNMNVHAAFAETEVRKSIGSTEVCKAALTVIEHIDVMMKCLLHATSQDIHLNCSLRHWNSGHSIDDLLEGVPKYNTTDKVKDTNITNNNNNNIVGAGAETSIIHGNVVEGDVIIIDGEKIESKATNGIGIGISVKDSNIDAILANDGATSLGLEIDDDLLEGGDINDESGRMSPRTEFVRKRPAGVGGYKHQSSLFQANRDRYYAKNDANNDANNNIGTDETNSKSTSNARYGSKSSNDKNASKNQEKEVSSMNYDSAHVYHPNTQLSKIANTMSAVSLLTKKMRQRQRNATLSAADKDKARMGLAERVRAESESAASTELLNFTSNVSSLSSSPAFGSPLDTDTKSRRNRVNFNVGSGIGGTHRSSPRDKDSSNTSFGALGKMLSKKK